MDRQPSANQVADLRARLRETEEMLHAIQQGEVDALVIREQQGERVYTLTGADRPYRVFVESMNEGAVTLTPDGTILYCNRRFAEILGAPLESVMGGYVLQFVTPQDRGPFETILRDGLEPRGSGEVRLLGKDGPVPCYLSFNSLPLDQEGPVICMVVTDLTERERSRELERLREEAEAANREKDRFLAALSHELRTPLTPVLMMLPKLQEDDRLPDDIRHHLEMMRRNVELEARLIDDMLDLTRISRGKLELRREVSDLRQILDHALQTTAGGVIQKRLRLVTDFHRGDHRIWGDVSRLTQVFWNLINNAVKFTPQDGTITVHTFRRDDPTGSWLEIQIADTGIGIDENVLEHIFDAFNQGQPGTTREFGGLGLGLSISRTIVELHGGSLTATSTGKNQGAVLSVTLPVGDLGAAADEAPRVGPSGDEARDGALRILLVEDHADTAAAMVDLLRASGHQVTWADSVAEGLAAASRERGIDLVVSDLGLPDGSGLDLMRELSERYGLKGIALSGYGMEEDLRRSREAGFERHLTKPIDFQSLQAVLREVVQR